jgi:hypothetical protein
MPGHLLHENAIVQCAHFPGQWKPPQTDQRVKVSGQKIVTLSVNQSESNAFTGCSEPPPTTGKGPCVTAKWTSAARRVKASGQPVLLTDSQARCVPNGGDLKVISTQTRVKGA